MSWERGGFAIFAGMGCGECGQGGGEGARLGIICTLAHFLHQARLHGHGLGHVLGGPPRKAVLTCYLPVCVVEYVWECVWNECRPWRGGSQWCTEAPGLGPMHTLDLRQCPALGKPHLLVSLLTVHPSPSHT